MAVKKKQKKDPKAPAWLTSWGDLTTLLLTFFITMISFAEIDGKDFYLVLSSFRGSLGMFTGGFSLSKGRLEELGQTMQNLPSTEVGRALAKSLKQARSLFQPEISTKKVRVTDDERGLIISLSADAFFDPGSAVLKEDIKPVISKLAKVIHSVPNFVRIEGHTDSRPPMKDSPFPTNWELSAARGVNVLRFLSEIEKVQAKRLSAVAFGEERALDSNNTPEGRAYNRRVDVVILRDKIFQLRSHKKIGSPLPDEEWR